jgi:hypothetical protein
MLLLLNVLLDDARGADNIRIGPQARKFPLQYRKLLPQQPGGTSFDQLDKPLHEIMHHFQFLDLGLTLLAYPRADLFQAALDGFHEHLSPLLRTPDDMSMTCRGHILTAPVGPAHRIQYTAPHFYCQEHLFYTLPTPPMPQIRNAPFIPIDESQGLSDAVFGKQNWPGHKSQFEWMELAERLNLNP